MTAPLPWGWTAHRHPDTMEAYYHHRPTQTSHYEHPLDAVCRKSMHRMQSTLQQQENAKKRREELRLEANAWMATQDCLEQVT